MIGLFVRPQTQRERNVVLFSAAACIVGRSVAWQHLKRLCSRLGFPQWKWKFMRDHCKLSFLSPTPRFRVSSRARASRASTFLRYPQMESLLAGYGKKKLHILNGFRQSEMYAVEYYPMWPSFRKNLATPLPGLENHCGKLLVKSVCLQRQVQCTLLTIKNWPKQETARKKVSDCLTAWSIWPDLCSQGEIFIASIRP